MIGNGHLFILEPHQQNLFHEGELGLLAPLGTFTDVAGIKGNLVAIFRALV